MADIKFCEKCNNLLYPREDKVNKVLLYSCRNCTNNESTGNPCVYSHILNDATKVVLLPSDVVLDPTLPRTQLYCTSCHVERPCVYFQQFGNKIDAKMTLRFQCTECHYFFQNEEHTETQGVA